MTRSDWIASLAAVAALLALIPPFVEMMRGRRRGEKASAASPPEAVAQDSEAHARESALTSAANAEEAPITLNAFGNALVLTGVAAAVGVVELVIFGLITSHFGVSQDPAQMPHLWRLGYYALLLVPGVLLLSAALYIFSLFGD